MNTIRFRKFGIATQRSALIISSINKLSVNAVAFSAKNHVAAKYTTVRDAYKIYVK